MEKYTPKIIEEPNSTLAYATMLVQIEKCPLCGKWMIRDDPFPKYYMLDKDIQSKRAGWVKVGHRDHGIDKYVCVECNAADFATFKCVLCQQQRKSSEVERSFGDPPEFLCKDCYLTTPAKQWDEKVSELEEEHQYDFE